MATSPKIFGIVLAGGEGKRLMPLTADRAKPAVPFGGQYRLIDFAISNLINSGLRQIVVLTQYKSHSLDRHISQTWRMSPMLSSYVASVPAQQRLGKRWFSGSADAILQSMNLIIDEQPDIVIVIGADHVYRMDFRQMLDAHIESGARATVAGIRQPIGLANQFGVIDVEPGSTRIREFLEKPQNPNGLADAPHEVLASMGNYIFDTDALIEAVEADGEVPTSNHDMGGDIVPYFVNRGEASVYDMKLNDVPGSTDRDRSYWRDVGTIDSFFDAHMDLISTLPVFNLYNTDWPIHSQTVNSPPAKFVRDSVGRIGTAIDSVVSLGSVLSGTHLERSVVGPWTLAAGGSTITDAVLFDYVRVGPGARVHRAILDKNVVVADGATIGVDRAHDLERGFTVTDSGITVVGKGVVVER
ncbi:MAG: glucose-1-phosphate adenylyltransferase [Actinobacteria bacterium]|jgi:glucose-1-phosphate adenylyltransferase|uniref:glucose-1-phosphate adenylyltransferase n=1 Tax=Microbacterium TaxID=33882 RepID=UPI000C45604D|nr:MULTISPECIES: glucose-1-phosphate adenylyltransferase [Microbacterium]MEC8763505.1 glucose-1-phosphate adenylyltransferase [Actinomycetota bacterium]HIE92647.1 glucose-1-phosphate adenylyltransferase [Acidobacteriota bacterium]MBU20648.1 glucose-1-phosphate adenylyltransferase [Microbacterium sp.]MCC4268508.1 glucose-1-phosphate adenylyltransferase [Microbacterium schleiferi]RUA25757.1 MAG: glucose-1-phosphate adenylyltransferase [Actinomycetota bacterium]|tara:strand:- start:928 stop:2169 length:1242 start_codon:yes stop_codon:yes gene_type:complete